MSVHLPNFLAAALVRFQSIAIVTNSLTLTIGSLPALHRIRLQVL